MPEQVDLSYKPLSEDVDVSEFDCGGEPWGISVAGFLREDALREQSLGLSKTFVFLADDRCAGFVTTLASQISTNKYRIPEVRYPAAPAVTIGRLGVSTTVKRRRVASTMLEWVLAEAFNSNFGVRYLTLVVDRDNEPACSLYEAFGFEDWSIGNPAKRFMVYDIYTE